jgi:hypothetical protein
VTLHNVPSKWFFVLGAVAIATAACSESLVAPASESVIAANLQPASSIIVYKHKKPASEIDARASGIDNGWTWVEVKLGTFAYIDPGTGQLAGGDNPPGYLTKVHVKFCKDIYKTLGLKQFSANIEYRVNDGDKDDIDKDPDNEPDSPLDPDDKAAANRPVNWDRSRKFLTLDGSGYVKIPFTGIPANSSLELQVHWSVPVTKKDGKIEYNHYEAKFCIDVDPAPDLAFTTAIGGTQGRTDTPTNFGYAVDVINGTDLPTSATCAVYIDGALYQRSDPFVMSAAISRDCIFPVQFATGGSHALAFRIENVDPGDFNPGNNAVTRTVQASDPSTGEVTARLLPSIKENVVTKVSNDTVYRPSRATPTSKTAFPSQTTESQDQSSTITIDFDGVFSYPVTFVLSQYTNDNSGSRLIHSITTSIPSCAATIGSSGLAPIGFSISYCPIGESGSSRLVYTTKATANLTSTGYVPTTGTFIPYGNSNTFNVRMIANTPAGERTYEQTVTVPIQTTTIFTQANDCGPALLQQVCHYGTTNSVNRVGSANISATLNPLGN